MNFWTWLAFATAVTILASFLIVLITVCIQSLIEKWSNR